MIHLQASGAQQQVQIAALNPIYASQDAILEYLQAVRNEDPSYQVAIELIHRI